MQARLNLSSWSVPELPVGRIGLDRTMFELIDATGSSMAIDTTERAEALRRGEALHRELRPNLDADYVRQLELMFEEGARLVQLVDEGEPRAISEHGATSDAERAFVVRQLARM